MKVFYLISFLFLFTLQTTYAMEKTLNWKFENPKSKELIEFGTKGSVQEALIRKGDLPNPQIGMNEKLFDWIEEHNWELTSSFTVDINNLGKQIVELEFPSVDTYAKIYLNGTLILSCDNAFRPYRIKVNHLLKNGNNELKAVFTPPVIFHKDNYLKAKYKLPAANDTHKIAIAPYTRKPQYQFGWDWTFRMNTIGFNKEVKLVSYSENKIISSNLQTRSIANNKAELSVELLLSQPINKQYKWRSQLFGDIAYTQNNQWLQANVTLANPELWWPKDFGKQHLYSDTWQLLDEAGQVIDQKTITFGVKTSRLLQEKDAFGTSYEIEINGKIIFCKGGNYIPQEVFPAQVTDESIRTMIEQMTEANFNMVRVWGGGYYPDDVFFEECSKKGIMVWQDFMFACSMYPGDSAFLATVKEEIDYQIPRITSHPSVVLFNGNNEVAIAWKNWGYQVKYNLFGESAKEIEKAYDDLFKGLMPQEIERFTSIPYIHTSPLSNWGKAEYYNHGSQHYWGVWHGKDPIEDFGNKSGRFNSEYGFQSFPEYSTLSRVLEEKDWDLNSEAMKLRQKSYVGNGMIKKQSDILYGSTDDFKKFIYYSQLTQAKAVGIAIASHRTDWPRCAGTIFWQVNDCWPSPTWSSIDYFGNWKALHYEAQKNYANIAVLAVERKLNHKEFYIVSDAVDTFTNDVCFDFYNLQGDWLEQHSFFVKMKPQSVVSLPVFDLMQKKLNNYIVRASWKDKDGKDMERIFYNKLTPENPFIEEVTRVEVENNGEHQKLIITSNIPLLDCWIYSETKAFHLDQNFDNLLPGRHEFILKRNVKITPSDIKIRHN